MSILSPLSSPPLTQARLAEILRSQAVTDPYPHLLRWLVWFPLLSVEELTRLEQARLGKQERTRSQSRMAAYLKELEEFQLIAHLVVNEPGWPPHQHRYFLTDAGLYTFAGQADPPLSVPRLAQAYAVERADLLARLANIDTHLVLAEFSTRLFVEGNTHGYPLTSFQQPWIQADVLFGRRQTLRCDTAFLLADSQEEEHAFYVLVDTNERYPFDEKRKRLPLLRLLNLRHALHLQQETMPGLLIITGASRLADWGTLLEKTSAQYGTALLVGGITTLKRLQTSGAYGTIWWTLAELVRAMNGGYLTDLASPTVQISHLMGAPASRILAERFSQRRTFAHIVTERKSGPMRKTSRPLPSYVGKPLTHEISTLRKTSFRDGLRGTKAEQQEAVALLNLALSATQKDLLFWLTHHQLLTVHQLATLHYPAGHDVQSLQKQMGDLFLLDFLVSIPWYKARVWSERERYVLSESALRYTASREGKQITSYLLSEEEKKKKKYKVLAFSIQRGTGGLFSQMDHTHGLYESIARLLEASHREKVQIITWKSAHESVRKYHHPFDTALFPQIRPDAEVIYQVEGQAIPHTILVEYDRATCSKSDDEAKYQGYVDYQNYTRLMLPPILVITQHEQSAEQIRTSVDLVGGNLSVIIILEDQLPHQGLLTMLAVLDRPQ